MFGLSVEGGKVMQRNSDVSKTQDAEGHTVAASAAGAAVAPDSDKPKPKPKVAKNSAATAGGAKNRQRSEPQRSRQALAELPQSLRARRK